MHLRRASAGERLMPLGLLLALLWGSVRGVSAPWPFTSLSQRAYRPDNVHSAFSGMPDNVRRVAVLPIAGRMDGDASAGRKVLEPILLDELAKSKRFEVVRVSADALSRWLGKADWTGGEELPAHFFNSLTNASACDAVMFVELTTYRAYAPLAMGWRLRLVDASTGEMLWTVDEVFDGAQTAVQVGARQFSQHRGGRSAKADDWTMAHSPCQFGRYSLATLFALLPER